MSDRVLIMAGGTGGHVFPALAVAQELREQGIEVTWLGTRKGLEARVVPEAGFPITYISISGLRGKGMIGWLLAPLRLSIALWQALRICLHVNPRAVLGMGGFVTGPGGVAARLLRRPLVIQEQNAVAGMTNRILSHFAQRVLEAFPNSFASSIQTEQTGNPVRKDINSLATPEERMAARQNQYIRLLVVGGSLGAQSLNEVVPEALARLKTEHQLDIWHQAGREKETLAEEAYTSVGIQAQVTPFISDMAEAYAWADIVICRAGALTISELAIVGLPSILVPYPYAVDDHQTRNALFLSDAGGARLILQAELSSDHLASTLKDMLATGSQGLLTMAQHAQSLAKPEATKRVAAICREVMHA